MAYHERKGRHDLSSYGKIKTDEPRTLDFSGVRGFLVTNMFIVQCSAAYNVHRFEPPLLTFQRP